jgi:hypothetical protein
MDRLADIEHHLVERRSTGRGSPRPRFFQDFGNADSFPVRYAANDNHYNDKLQAMKNEYEQLKSLKLKELVGRRGQYTNLER